MGLIGFGVVACVVFGRLGPQQPAQPLGFFLSAAEGARNLHGQRGVGQVHGKVGDLADDQDGDLALTEALEKLVALFLAGAADDQRRVQLGGKGFELLDVHADDQRRLAGVQRQNAFDLRGLGGVFAGDAEHAAAVGGVVLPHPVVGHFNANLDAAGFGDPALTFEGFPRHVGFFGADEGEDVFFAAVFAHQGGGEAQPATGLDGGGGGEHGRGQQVDFVVDDQPPVFAIKQSEMFERGVFVFAAGQNLVGGDGDRGDVFGAAAVFGDLVGFEGGFVEQLGDPLAYGGGGGRQDERGGARGGHGGDADDGFAGAAGQHNDAAAAHAFVATSSGKGIDRVLLVRTQGKGLVGALLRGVAQLQVQRSAAGVPGVVLGGVAGFDERLLDHATARGVEHEHGGVGVVTQVQVVGQAFGTSQLVGEFLRVHLQPQVFGHAGLAVGENLLEQPQPAVALGLLAQLADDVARWGEAGVPLQGGDHVVGAVARGPGVPHRERGDAVGVHVLGAFDQLGEAQQVVAGVGVAGVVHLQQEGVVALNDQGAVGHGQTG